jgi:hypothetical protein
MKKRKMLEVEKLEQKKKKKVLMEVVDKKEEMDTKVVLL